MELRDVTEGHLLFKEGSHKGLDLGLRHVQETGWALSGPASVHRVDLQSDGRDSALVGLVLLGAVEDCEGGDRQKRND